METMENGNVSVSSSHEDEQASSSLSQNVGKSSAITEPSQAGQGDSTSFPNEKSLGDETEPTEPPRLDTKATEIANEDEEQLKFKIISEYLEEKRNPLGRKKKLIPLRHESLDSDSEGYDSDNGSAISGFVIDYILRSVDTVSTPGSLPRAYKAWIKGGLDQSKHGSKIIKRLLDSLGALDKRLKRLESSKPRVKAKGTKAGLTDVVSTSDGDGDGGHGHGHAPRLEITVKFFDAAAYAIQENGDFPAADSETEEGTFTCCHDSQQLIRVLYSKLRPENSTPSKQANSEPPKPGDIDVLTFGVLSEAISTFFAERLGVDADPDHLIRFGKPFRPVLRHLETVRKQLERLEAIDDQVKAQGMIKGDEINDGSDEARGIVENRMESDALPFASSVNDKTDDLPAYERPAALPHFKVFMTFVDEFLGPQIRLYERFRKGKEHRVAFENLWMLFDANDTIYCPLRETAGEEYENSEGTLHRPIRRDSPQAYRIVATSGGMPIVSTIAPIFKPGKRVNTLAAATVLATKPFMNNVDQSIAEIMTQSAQIERRVRDIYTPFNVYCFYLDYDGATFGIVRDVFIFKPYEREMDVRGLEVYPSQYAPSSENFEHGGRFLDATRVSHLQYKGLTVGAGREEINSPVVVDIKLAFEERYLVKDPGFQSPAALWFNEPIGESFDLVTRSSCPYKWCYSRKCTANLYRIVQKQQRAGIESKIRLVLEEYESEKRQGKEGLKRFKETMEEHGMLELLPTSVPGFALRNRKWTLLNLARLRPVESNSEWKDLVLPPGHREMVQAMVETHTQDLGSDQEAEIGMDLIQGKGRGCIILLHGVPGVGKTSTAECVAAHTKKPLYPITCGDIGVHPAEVERNMESHFKLAHTWGCVLLLDEADVFLAKRDQRDVQRNGLVSVFLRMLEYYSGILFLTTNRVGAIDDAFRSRLHLTLYYPKLDKSQTKAIFKNNFRRIEDINADRAKKGLLTFEYTESKIMAWAKQNRDTLKWNGRQIRNAFQTVLALAEFDTKQDNKDSTTATVTKKHFKIVASATKEFNKYLLETHGYTEDKVAKRDFMRAEDYKASGDALYTPFRKEASDSSSDADSSDDDRQRKASDSDSDESSDSEKEKGKSSSKKKGKERKGKEKKEKKGKKGGKKDKGKKKDRKDQDDSDDSD